MRNPIGCACNPGAWDQIKIKTSPDHVGGRASVHSQGETNSWMRDEDGCSHDMKRDHHRLPRMIDHGKRIHRRHRIFHNKVDRPRHGHDHMKQVKHPLFPSLHRNVYLAVPSRTKSVASTRRTAELVAVAVKVAPAIARMARCSFTSSLNGWPLYC